MRLRSLRKLEEIELKKEKNNLLSEQETLLKILSDEGIKKNVLIDEIKEIKNRLNYLKLTEAFLNKIFLRN